MGGECEVRFDTVRSVRPRRVRGCGDVPHATVGAEPSAFDAMWRKRGTMLLWEKQLC